MPTISSLSKGAWSNATTYNPGDIVTSGGSSYICIATNLNNIPPNVTYWALLASIGATGATGPTGPTGATGSGATVDTDGTLAANSDIKVASQKATKTYVDTTTISKNGWIPTTDTLVYVSASSFKIAGADRSLIYTKGTRIKFTNNSITYYGVVISTTFSTDTTVALAPNSDFSINNSAITNPFYSYVANPQGYPGWFAYAPTFTWNSTPPSSPTTVAKFSIIGNTIFYAIKQSNANAGTTNTQVNISLNVTPIGTFGQHNYTASGVVSTADATGAVTNSAFVDQYDTGTPIFQVNFASISAKSVFVNGFLQF